MDARRCLKMYIFSILDISSLLRSNNLYYILISPIERLKTINPGAGHLPGSFIPTPGGEFANFFKKSANARGLTKGGRGWALLELTDALCHCTLPTVIQSSNSSLVGGGLGQDGMQALCSSITT